MAGSPAKDDATSVRDPLLSTKLGDYQVVGPLGEGGMGVVYEGLHTVINKRGAIKVIKPEFAADQILVRRVLAEAQAVNAVRHRGIVDIHAHGLTPDGRPYLVMELLQGETVYDLLHREGRLSQIDALKLLLEATGPLFAAHKAGIVHRDLKPSNLFLCVDDDGEKFLKLLDFGLAKRSAPGVSSSTMTSASLIVGTPDYMAPEQARAQPTDQRTDIYALGVMAYELLAGRLPFTAATSVDLVMMHLTAPVPKLIDADAATPLPLSQLVEQMMAKEPASRPATLEPVRALLKQLVAKHPHGFPTSPMPPISRATPVHLEALPPRVSSPDLEQDPLPTVARSDRTVIAEIPSEPPAGDEGTADTAMSLQQVAEPRPSARRRDSRGGPVPTPTAQLADRKTDEASSPTSGGASKTPFIVGGVLVAVIVLSLSVVFLGGNRTVTPEVPVDTKPVDAKPVDTKPVDTKPVDTKPVDAKPVDAKPVDAKPVDAKPVDAKPVDAKPVDTKPVDTKPVDAKPVDSRPVAKPVDPKPVVTTKPDVKKPGPRVPTVAELERRIGALELRANTQDNPALKLHINRYRTRLVEANTEADRLKLSRDLDEFEKSLR
ncbi:MAG: protein kinase [Archangiaceae bacterium]|nr:protein kinase [Archangiaceae bacterium]